MRRLLASSVVCLACSSPAPQNVTLTAPSSSSSSSAQPAAVVREAPQATAAPTAFFPPATFPERIDGFVSDWYGKHLRAMHEPSLWASAVRNETVWRFLLLRTWGKPIAIRVTRDGHLVATRLSGQGGYDPGTIDARREKTLASADVKRIESALAAASFDTTATEGDMGMDGAEWVIERAMGGAYRLVERWSPDVTHKDPAFVAACDVFIELAGRDLL